MEARSIPRAHLRPLTTFFPIFFWRPFIFMEETAHEIVGSIEMTQFGYFFNCLIGRD